MMGPESAANGSVTYVFCLVESSRRPSTRSAPCGFPGAGAPRALAVDRGIWAIAANVLLSRFSAGRLEEELRDVEAVSRHALAHAAIVEFFSRRSPVIPLKLFTLFSEDARAKRELAARRVRLRALFARIRGREEWGVHVAVAAASDLGRKRPTTGREYLRVKQRARDRKARVSAVAAREIAAALKPLTRLASKTAKDRTPEGSGGGSVVRVSFLVPIARRTRWKREVRRAAAALGRQGHRLELSGPWPPYHFVR